MEQEKDKKTFNGSGIYRVILNISISDIDEDMCGIINRETKYNNLFNSREVAINKAQSLFDNQPLNDYVLSVNAYVQELKFNEDNEGKWGNRIFNRYKEIPHNIYGRIIKD